MNTDKRQAPIDNKPKTIVKRIVSLLENLNDKKRQVKEIKIKKNQIKLNLILLPLLDPNEFFIKITNE